MARANVRSHQRTTNGKTTTVRQHTRRKFGRRGGLVSPRHSWKLLRKGFRAARSKKRATAAAFGALALAELTAWLTLGLIGLLMATVGAIALGVAWLAATAGGVEL